MRFPTFCVLPVLLILLVPASVPSTSPPSQGAHPAEAQPQASRLWSGCEEINASTFSYCVFVQNSVSTSGVPANQTVGPENDVIQNATVISTIGTPQVIVEWSCSRTVPLYSVTFQMTLFGQNVYSALETKLTDPTVGCVDGYTSIGNSELTSLGFFLSGVYPASLTFYDSQGNPVGSPLAFMVKLISAYQPFTLFFLLLSVIFLYEVVVVVRNFVGLGKKLKKARAHASPTPLPPANYPPQGPPGQWGRK